MARSHEDWIEVTSYQLGMVFEQSSTDASGGQWFLKNTNTPGVGELDFAAADSSEEIGATVTYTYTVTNTYPSAVEHHDYDLLI